VSAYREIASKYLLFYSTSGRLLHSPDVSIAGSVGFDSVGDLLVPDTAVGRIQAIDASGRFLRSFPYGPAPGPGEVRYPVAIAIDGRGTVALADGYGVRLYSEDGTPKGSVPLRTLGGAGSIAYDSAGALVVPVPVLRMVVTIAPSGAVVGSFAPREDVFGFGPNFGYVAAGRAGTLWLSDTSRDVVRQYTDAGQVLKTCVIGDPEAPEALRDRPSRQLEPGPLAVGPNGDLVVASQSAKGAVIWVMRGADRPGRGGCLLRRKRLQVSLRVRELPRRATGRGRGTRPGRLEAQLRLSRRARLRAVISRCRSPRRGPCRGTVVGTGLWRAPAGLSRRPLRLPPGARSGRYLLTVTDADSQSPRPGTAGAAFLVRR